MYFTLNLLAKFRYMNVRVILNKLRSVCVSAKTRYCCADILSLVWQMCVVTAVVSILEIENGTWEVVICLN